MNAQTIRIGTRGSALALWQAHHIAALLTKGGLLPQIVTIETKGDKILDKSLAKIGSKGVFTAELEDGLRDGSIDIAVHSAKDMQSQLPEDLEIIAFTQREVTNDVLISFNKTISLDDQHPWVVGTSSTRRVAMLKHYYPHIKTVDMRGNLQTRMKKLEDGQCEAIILAFAGVHRMDYDKHIVSRLPLDKFTPAVGQGSVAVESSVALDAEKRSIIRNLCNHPDTEYCLLSERAYLNKLQGGCSIPVFALATLHNNIVNITGGIISLNGKQLVKKTLQSPAEEAVALGQRLSEEVLGAGGDTILKEIRNTLKDIRKE
ncbi:hydroxymethylbilane synthase [Rhodocytophaga aerolata]|uniref:Hydroxymethylbilane synthase n=1 Tax=Rhodocytophaga aerolata TaxID=455078 RepID=A0ABT8REA7_9BACT|nr:hydroxymethylbilane synthase [Rhodocytophaga aerolata]MDO1449065.1 hydroxymethylbilane synthase [Rhodocytophaga aerolata]